MKLGPTMEFDHIQPAIRKRFTSAADIPKEVFSDPDVYREELTRIFYGPYWHPIAHRAELAERNAFRTRWLADVPLLMVRDGDDRIRVFVNSCAHRGTLLEQRRCGVAERFECPYHRWIFNNDGRFAGAPRRMQFRPDFREEDYGLRELHVVEAWGLIFVSMAAQPPPFDDYLGDSADPLRDCMVDDGNLTLLGYQTVVFQSNWKTYIDNDPYHAPLLHSAFKLLNWQGGSGNVLVSKPYGHMSILYDAQPYVDNGFLADPSVVTRMGDDSRARVIALRPVTGIVRHVDTINIRYARPLGVDRTEVRYTFFGHASDSEDFARHRVRQSSNLLGPSGFISIEDAAVYNRVQATARDGGYQRFVAGVGRPLSESSQNDEVANTGWWAHYQEVMEFC
ncbi:(2Fe-2S)-binding protein [Mycolicibacterium monacense DSM 44395]|uniref:3-phenylpropionate dioxygenase n=5 Tax=Mycobacteriaceae TaxID=1762 RepID=A0AAD1J343_MYCMB|nr:(2Fe-2S)-binding protein [Mycolicibacterium monacense DSM 44395]ORB13148.1 (2Fe-2S)-binding protein [Mycolicibacterium monacense DSM 44395]QHP85388.1 aromatic ring-hydroxylating dioxygenase subunit alpha [Mycolicibacterium monacense DSM 44395]BBZ61737.1 3-phenylpropionate dioxygenase [Mycolicibacterium monacense]